MNNGNTSVRDRVVVLTGASAGVGRATARELARRGARIALLARDPERLEATRAEVHELGGEAIAIPTDVASAEQVEEAAERAERDLGPIAVWINNAMVSVFTPADALQAEELRRVTEVTYLGAAYGTLAALRWMRLRNSGVIVQVGSALAYRSIPLQAAYCGAKHAVVGFTESVRTELLHDRSDIQIAIVQLPALNTPQFTWVKSRLPRKPQPVPPIFQPEVAARAIVWAAEHPRREVLVGLPTLASVWGDRLAPGLLDRFLARTGYEAQQTAEPADPDRPDNLWQPVRGPFAAHGEFGARSHARSPQFWITTHRKVCLAAALVVAGAVLWRRPRNARWP